MNLSIGKKISLGFAAVIIFLIFTAGLSYYFSVQTDNLFGKFRATANKGVGVAEIQNNLTLALAALEKYTYTNSGTDYKNFKEHIDEAHKDLVEFKPTLASKTEIDYFNNVEDKISDLDKSISEMESATLKLGQLTSQFAESDTKALAQSLQKLAEGSKKALNTSSVEQLNQAVKQLEISVLLLQRFLVTNDTPLKDKALECLNLSQGHIRDGLVGMKDSLAPATLTEIQTQNEQMINAFSAIVKQAEIRSDLTLNQVGKKTREVTEDLEKFRSDSMFEQNKIGPEIAQKNSFVLTMQMTISIVAIVIGSILATAITLHVSSILKQIINGLRRSVEEIHSATEQNSSNSQTLAEGSSTQAASLEETSASLEEISSMTKRNAENSENASHLSTQALGAAEQGVLDAVELRKATSEVALIIKSVDEIAFQTNILALNAAVEAARAGEAGMGFSIVADEVRNLAQSSAKSARQISEKIDSIIKISHRVTDSMSSMSHVARNVNDLVTEITMASKEQSAGINQISTAVMQIDHVTQQNAAGSEEIAASSQELTSQVAELNSIIDNLSSITGTNEGVRINPLMDGAPGYPVTTKIQILPGTSRSNTLPPKSPFSKTVQKTPLPPMMKSTSNKMSQTNLSPEEEIDFAKDFKDL
jgi:methyl-accepting chemotaxis protein